MAHHFCPEYVEALAGEQLDRVKILADEAQVIEGIPVVQLTPFLWDTLAANRSPYTDGSKVTCAAILQFLWIIRRESGVSKWWNKWFRKDETCDEWLNRKALSIDYFSAAQEISAYIERTFMDSMEGESSVPYYPLSASLAFRMAKEPYRWPVEKTIHEPLRRIFLYLRPVDESNGVPLINKRSDGVMAEAIAEIERMREAGELTEDQIRGFNPLDRKEEKHGA